MPAYRLIIEGLVQGVGFRPFIHRIAHKTGVLLLFQVSGDIVEKAVIKEFSTDKEFYSTPFTVNFLTRVENLSNVHIKPRGTIVISNMLGKETSIIRVNEKGSNILPNSIRRFESSWQNNFGFDAKLGGKETLPRNSGILGQIKSCRTKKICYWKRGCS